MAPPSATLTMTEPQRPQQSNLASKMNVLHLNGSDTQFDKTDVNGVVEDYTGNYRFAPIEEADVSRAMIKRY